MDNENLTQNEVTTPAKAGKSGLMQDKKKTGILAAILVAVIAIVAIIIGASTNSPKAVAKKFSKAYFGGNGSKVVKCYSNEILKIMAEEEDCSVKEVKDGIKDDLKEQKEYLEDKYGKYSVKVKVLSVNKLAEEDYLEFVDEIAEKFMVGVKDARKVWVRVTIKGKDDSVTKSIPLYIVKIGSKWTVISDDLY